MNDWVEMTDEEFERTERMLADSAIVNVGHLKDVVAWIREEGKKGRYMSGRGLVCLAETLLNWMASESHYATREIIN